MKQTDFLAEGNTRGNLQEAVLVAAPKNKTLRFGIASTSDGDL